MESWEGEERRRRVKRECKEGECKEGGGMREKGETSG